MKSLIVILILLLAAGAFSAPTEVIVRNKSGTQTHGGAFANESLADSWIADQTRLGAWGKNFTVTKRDMSEDVANQEKKKADKTARTILLKGMADKDLTAAEMKLVLKALIEASTE